ncbi:hypothetical protein BASA83_003017 [Batrachochytrium salamandrivorans]|nr:hypothetical protein BASA83_003017 [Batrachochytrium salamandrivorans]
MQFYLLSFVAVVSHAAALPQPAGLFEKYSNDVDTNSASGLEARSYQPGLNSHKDSATLVSLKRRDDSDGSSGENSGSDSFLPSTSGPNEPFKSPFTDSNVSSMNLASTIDNVGDGVLNLYKDGEESLFGVTSNTPGSSQTSQRTSKNGKMSVRARLNAIVDATTNILEDVGSITENLQTIGRSFDRTLFNRRLLIWKLIRLLRLFESSKALLGYLGDIVESSAEFLSEQQSIYMGFMIELGASYYR